MAVKPLELQKFMELAEVYPVLDVRSPGEFSHARIPGAYSLPLFSDEERKVVGTAYKQQSREHAIKIGLDYFGVKMRKMVEEVERLLKDWKKQGRPGAEHQTVLVHCWRGGMRSAGVAWLLDLYGFKVYTLIGGYKAYRRSVLDAFEMEWPIHIIGGYTGAGKTDILQKLERLGEPVIDLEGLAHHKGSAFGHLGLSSQPSQEMFENCLAGALRNVLKSEQEKTPGKVRPIWMEDESLRIGHLFIPQPLYKQMRKAQCYFIDIPFEARLQHIVKDYGVADRENLIQATLRIQKRLGGLETKQAINCLIENDIEGAFTILLKYYDKWYGKSIHTREPGAPPIRMLNSTAVDEARNAQLLLTAAGSGFVQENN
ncbi:tRNA 2-selenouridine(34) synthase MnmH [Flavihumibacter rivuli]|uniref:tRNA 2-selenouridine(34) synthase MnmH n=1 Tax=Flavihumibacter rivuli TaxID=2838156 RepID=UPI001BDF64B4|nr:tRNA 2-selenouridine(34) synthase MnmH [Flavihumibacter rivuli]ULQ55722.1 tRNA 2-selenouridine(34) synthase MnmH [Flavihumibacter rivuli]